MNHELSSPALVLRLNGLVDVAFSLLRDRTSAGHEKTLRRHKVVYSWRPHVEFVLLARQGTRVLQIAPNARRSKKEAGGLARSADAPVFVQCTHCPVVIWRQCADRVSPSRRGSCRKNSSPDRNESVRLTLCLSAVAMLCLPD